MTSCLPPWFIGARNGWTPTVNGFLEWRYRTHAWKKFQTYSPIHGGLMILMVFNHGKKKKNTFPKNPGPSKMANLRT